MDGCAMGNAGRKGRQPRTKNDVENQDDKNRALGAFGYCTCELHTVTLEDPFSQHVSLEHEMDKCDLACSLLGLTKKPRNKVQIFNYVLAQICCEALPMFCCPPCPNAIISKVAFVRLDKPTYEFVSFGSRWKNESDIDYRFRRLPGSYVYSCMVVGHDLACYANLQCSYIDDGRGGRVACVYAGNFSAPLTGATLTVLYSHGNGADLGVASGYAISLARLYGVNVFTYDYPGFGQSSGPCCDDGVYRSVEIVYDYITKILKVSQDEIVAIGTSLGCAATIHLASNRRLKGVVLHGAFLSAARVLCPYKRRIWRKDRFPNVEKIVNIHAPTLFVHGTEDEYFSSRHAKLLRANCPGASNIEPLYIDKCGHMDFLEHQEYYKRVHAFLHSELISLAQEPRCCSYRAKEARQRMNQIRAAVGLPAAVPRWLKRNSERTYIPVVLCDSCLDKSAL